jgi:hypothetical protein
MKTTPLTVIALLLLAALAGAGITWVIIHKRFATTDNLDDAFYAFVVKEPHNVVSEKGFKDALNSVQNNGQQDINTSYCFELDGELLQYGPPDSDCIASQPHSAALTHKIYAVSAWDIAKVAVEIDGKVAASTTTPTPTP